MASVLACHKCFFETSHEANYDISNLLKPKTLSVKINVKPLKTVSIVGQTSVILCCHYHGVFLHKRFGVKISRQGKTAVSTCLGWHQHALTGI